MPTKSTCTWMDDQRKDHIDTKGPKQRNHPNNYRPITCQPMMWKLLIAQIREEIYYSLTSCGLFADKQKGCCKGSRGTAELLYIDQHILNESKTRRKNLAMAWIDYKKAYDMVPHSWIINSLKMYKWSHELYRQNHENLESGIDSRRKKLSWSKDPKRYFPRRCSITLTIHNYHDAIYPYLRRTRKLLETKLSSRNLIKWINTWAVPLVRYSGPFLKWTRDELKQIDQRTRKLMTMHKALHPRDNVDRLYVLRKEGERGLASIEDSVGASIQRFEDYIQKHDGGLIKAISGIILEEDQGRIQTNGPENWKTNDHASQRWRWKTICIK